MRISTIIIQGILGFMILLSLGSMYYETEMAKRDCSVTSRELQTGKYIQEFSSSQEITEFLLNNYNHTYRIYKLHLYYQLIIGFLLIILVIDRRIAIQGHRKKGSFHTAPPSQRSL